MLDKNDAIEYDFFKSVILYKDVDNYDNIPDELIERHKGDLNWDLLIKTLIKENRLDKEFLLKYTDYLKDSEWVYISKHYNFSEDELEAFLYKISWCDYLGTNNNLVDFSSLIKLGIFNETKTNNLNLQTLLFRTDLVYDIDLGLLETVINSSNFDETQMKHIISNFVASNVVDMIFIENYMEYLDVNDVIKYQTVDTEHINKHGKNVNVRDLIKYQTVNLSQLTYKRKGWLSFLRGSMAEMISYYSLWVYSHISSKSSDLLNFGYNILSFNIDKETGLFIKHSSDNHVNVNDLSTNNGSENKEDFADDSLITYGFIVLKNNVEVETGVSFNEEFAIGDNIVSNGYYNDHTYDHPNSNHIPKMHKHDKNSDKRIYTNIVKSPSDHSFFYGLKILNHEMVTDYFTKSKDVESTNVEMDICNDNDIKILMVAFDIDKHCMMFGNNNEYLTSDRFGILNIYTPEEFLNNNPDRDFKKYFIDTYNMSIQDYENEETDETDGESVKNKVIDYLKNSPDVSFASVPDEPLVEEKPNTYLYKIFGI
jgi:hypothetical protein